MPFEYKEFLKGYNTPVIEGMIATGKVIVELHPESDILHLPGIRAIDFNYVGRFGDPFPKFFKDLTDGNLTYLAYSEKVIEKKELTEIKNLELELEQKNPGYRAKK
jgi:hypothetical protein